MFFIIFINSGYVPEIKGDYKSLDDAKIALENVCISHVKEISGLENSQDPFKDINCDKSLLKDGAYLIRISDDKISIYEKKTIFNRGWISSSLEYNIKLLGSYYIISYEPKNKEIVIEKEMIKVFCENCSNRVNNEPILTKKVKKDNGNLVALIDELKTNCKFLLQQKFLA